MENEVECPWCLGTGEEYEPELGGVFECSNCQGTGKVISLPVEEEEE